VCCLKERWKYTGRTDVAGCVWPRVGGGGCGGLMGRGDLRRGFTTGFKIRGLALKPGFCHQCTLHHIIWCQWHQFTLHLMDWYTWKCYNAVKCCFARQVSASSLWPALREMQLYVCSTVCIQFAGAHLFTLPESCSCNHSCSVPVGVCHCLQACVQHMVTMHV
jgi:hypothetical protein